MSRGRVSHVEIFLYPDTEDQLLAWLRQTTCFAGVARRARVVVLRAAGLSIAEIMRRTGMTRRHIYKWLKRYKARGPAGLQTRPAATRRA